jgi:hypothetical protein
MQEYNMQKVKFTKYKKKLQPYIPKGNGSTKQYKKLLKRLLNEPIHSALALYSLSANK